MSAVAAAKATPAAAAYSDEDSDEDLDDDDDGSHYPHHLHVDHHFQASFSTLVLTPPAWLNPTVDEQVAALLHWNGEKSDSRELPPLEGLLTAFHFLARGPAFAEKVTHYSSALVTQSKRRHSRPLEGFSSAGPVIHKVCRPCCFVCKYLFDPLSIRV